MTNSALRTMLPIAAILFAGCAPAKDGDPYVRDCGELMNDVPEAATAIPSEDGFRLDGLELCQNDADFYEVQVEPGRLVSVEIEFEGSLDAAGDPTDLKLDVYDANGARINRADGGLSYERLAVLPDSDAGEFEVYRFAVSGYQGSTGEYDVVVRSFDWEDGMDCAAADAKSVTDDCKRIVQFPAPHGDDPWRFDSWAEYQNARRELVMLVRWALAQTWERYPTLSPLGLIDMSERDGSTPGTAYDDLRHPQGTHIEGNDMDIAYFQTTPDNRARVVCAQDDGYFCTSEQNTMNAEVQAYFMAQLYASNNVRVIGVDTTLADDIQAAGEALYTAGAISNVQRQRLYDIAYGSGWPFHHHHIHLSLRWDEGYELGAQPEGPHLVDPYPGLSAR